MISPKGGKTVDQKQRFVRNGIWIYVGFFFFLTILAWIPFLVYGRSSNTFPLSSFPERFSDLVHFARVDQKLAKPNLEDFDHLAGTMFPRNYGPLAILLYLFLLGVCSPYSVVVFLAVVLSALLVGAYLLWRAARRSPGFQPFMVLAIFGTVLLGLPTAETVMRANIEGLLWIGYAVGLGLMVSRRWGGSVSVLAIASCIKPYPMLWFVVLLWHRKYKQLALGCVVLLLTAVTCLTVIGVGNPMQGLHRARTVDHPTTPFFAAYIVGFRDVREAVGDHSLFQTAKSAARVAKARGFHLGEQEYGAQYSLRAGSILFAIYLPFAGISLLWVVWTIRKKPLLNQIFSLSICLTLLPLIAADYTLTILYIPMGLFLLFLLRDVSTGRASISQARLLSILIPCAWVMTPLPVFGIWAGDVRSLLLLFLLWIVLRTPMPMANDTDENLQLQAATVAQA